MHSYNKYPIVRQERMDKKAWNRKLRRDRKLWALRGSEYRKVYQNWHKWDYMWTLDEALTGRLSETYTKEWITEYWKRHCYRK